MGQLTPEALRLATENNALYFEIVELWKRHRDTIARWLRENKNPKLSNPLTVGLIQKYNTKNIKIVQE